MNTDRDKYLTGAMGICSHDFIPTSFPFFECTICYVADVCGEPRYIDFSTPDGFFKLWEWAQEQEWWINLLTGWMDDVYDFPTALIAPDTFAIAVYEFLKGRE